MEVYRFDLGKDHYEYYTTSNTSIAASITLIFTTIAIIPITISTIIIITHYCYYYYDYYFWALLVEVRLWTPPSLRNGCRLGLWLKSWHFVIAVSISGMSPNNEVPYATPSVHFTFHLLFALDSRWG